MRIIYQQTFRMLKENPVLWMLFVFLALLDFMALGVLFLSHSEPVSYVLAPVIRTFYSDAFLHYPHNFILLPKLLKHAHFLILSFIGIVITAAAIKKVEAWTDGAAMSAASGLAAAFKKYFSLLTAWFFFYGIFILAFKGIFSVLPADLWLQTVAGFLAALVIQSLFAFLLPAIMIEGRGFLKDVRHALAFGWRHLHVTALLIAVPVFLTVLMSLLKAFAPVYVRFYPEAVIWILSLGIIVSMAADLLITSSATLLFLKARTKI